jgi:hypothetical protein
MNRKEAAETLEQMIDRLGLGVVLGLLSEVCHEKAEHLASNWQDSRSARVWTVDAAKLGRWSEQVNN